MLSKKYFSRFVALLLVAIMAFAMLAGCGKKAETPADKSDDTANQDKPKEETKAPADNPDAGKLIAYANKSLDYYFFIICQEGLKRAAESKGYKFEASVANFDSAVQTNQFINFIAKKPAAIVSDPIDSEGLIDAVNKAREANIPVSIVDTPTTGGDVQVTVAFDNKLAGIMAAEEIVKRLKEKYGEEKGIVLNAYGEPSSWAWRLRKEGFDEVMAKYPKIQVLSMPGDGDMAKTHDVAVNALAKYPNLDAVHCPSDTPARGLAEALQQADKWKKVGEEGHVIFVTIDGEPVAVKNIQEGYYDASVVQDAISYGQISLELMEKYTFKGEKVPLETYKNDEYFWKEAQIVDSPSGPYVIIPPYVMDKGNVDDPRHWGTIAEKDWGIKYN